MPFYIIFDKKPAGQGYCKGFSSMRGISEFTKIPYSTLVNHFTRDRLRWQYYEDKGIEVIKVDSIEKGKQRVHRKGTAHNRNI